jgi:hypothetical protein
VVDAFSSPQADWTHAWRVLSDALGLSSTVKAGDHVLLTPTGLPPIEGVAFAAAPHLLAIRTNDGLYRFVKAGPVGLASHRIFSADVDRQQIEQAWQAWLNQLFA